MSLQLPSEMELIDGGMSKSKAYQVSMLSILGGIIFLMKTLCFFMPIPIGMFALYFFRDFKDLVVKALYIKNAMFLLTILVFATDIFSMAFVVILTISDVIMGRIAVEGDFNFSNFTILKMSVISQMPVGFGFLLIVAPMVFIATGATVFGILFCFTASIAAVGFASIVTGFMTLLSFKLIVWGISRIPNMINISKEHVGF